MGKFSHSLFGPTLLAEELANRIPKLILAWTKLYLPPLPVGRQPTDAKGGLHSMSGTRMVFAWRRRTARSR